MHPVGRLDLDTSGLLLFSKDGKLTQQLLSPQSKINRIYEARVLGKVDFNDLKSKLIAGVNTTDGSFPAELLHCEHYEESQDTLTKAAAKRQSNITELDDSDESETEPPTEISTSSTLDSKASIIDTNVTTCSFIRLSVMEGKYRMVRRI